MSFQSQFQSDYGELNAAIVMTVLPATIVYLIFQRYFGSGADLLLRHMQLIAAKVLVVAVSGDRPRKAANFPHIAA